MLNSAFIILLCVQAQAQRGRAQDPRLSEVSVRASGIPHNKVTN